MNARSMPSQDWSVPTINGEVMPKILRDRLSSFPTSILPGEKGGNGGEQLFQMGYSRISDDGTIASMLGAHQVNDQMFAALGESMHWRHASTRWGGGTSVESPHNSLHVIMGWPMASVEFAAFHPIFFLHHCNVDRIYEGYLKVDPNAEEEFQAEQLNLATEWGERNRFDTTITIANIHRYTCTHTPIHSYLEPLDPFKHPRTGKPFLSEHTFDTKDIGYDMDNFFCV